MATAAKRAARAVPRVHERDRTWVAIVGGCLAVAALTLVFPSVPTYDPMSWVLWGREITEGTLSTTTGPSWKPLPALFTVPFALAGDDAAPQLWLVIARAGGLLGIVMAFRLAARIGGAAAGAFAGLALFASEAYVYHWWRGNSEGLLVGISLWAIARHLDGSRRAAFLLGLGAALLRPEVWPLWGLYGLWIAWRDPRIRGLVVAGFAVLPVAWFVPELIGSGDFLRAATRARDPNLDSAAFAAFPAFEVLRRTALLVPLVVGTGAIAAVVFAVRRRDRVQLALAASTAALLAVVAVMTQIGFSGNLRYVVLPLALIAVLAGAGWVQLVRAARHPAAALAIGGLAVAFSLHTATNVAPRFDEQWHAAEREATLIDTLPAALERAGGIEALASCGALFATRYEVPAVAYEVHRHMRQVQLFALPPGATIARRGSRLAGDPRFPEIVLTDQWAIGTSCGRN